jgi:pimeloyl-ACP methyl ester carboxylesterase
MEGERDVARRGVIAAHWRPMPAYATHDGCTLHYQIVGDGPLIAITPGGREGKEALSPLAAELAKVLASSPGTGATQARATSSLAGTIASRKSGRTIWRSSCGATGSPPAYLAGGSAGCRVALLAALRHPDVAKGLVLWSASGGPYGCQFLGFQYHVPYIMAAQRGGMRAVAETPFFAARIAANPANLGRLLALSPAQFVDTLKRWNGFFQYRPDTPVVGATEDELRGIALPTLIFEGNDDIHPPAVAKAIAGLIAGATLMPSPWTREAWMDRFTGRVPGSVFDLYPLLAPRLLEFVKGG